MPRQLFNAKNVFIGVVHLPPLPGSPRSDGNVDKVLAWAEAEAAVLAEGGVHAIIVENFGDVPFRIGSLDPVTVSAMTLAVGRVIQTTSLPVGINMLRNDAASALAVAAVTGAGFIRVNVHYGVMSADEGLVTGEASETLRRRQALGVDVKILADVLVKHAVPLGKQDLGLMARETVQRGLADGLIISGPATGQPTQRSDVAEARSAVPEGFILVGSGVTDANARELLSIADGAIVGTSLKRDGVVTNPLDPQRVRAMAAVFADSA
jgi:membrane complex biogenesis BtpA family protein